MFDVAPSEFMLIAMIALLVIGPKDLPKVMRVVGKWVGKARAVAGQFRSGFDNMVREAEIEEMEKKWKAENDRIMQMHPITPPQDTAVVSPDEPSVIVKTASDNPA
jgi:sec-independent protein translocase protein TatB